MKNQTIRTMALRTAAILLTAVLLLSGCSAAPDVRPPEGETPVPTAPAETAEPVPTEEPVPEPTEEPSPEPAHFRFDVHVYSCFLEACYSDDYKAALFSLFEALEKGEDTFECASREIYDFCMDEAVNNQLYPVACMQITGKSPDGSEPFENGVGHIYYTKSKEDFLERQKDFRQEVEAIMDEWIRPDYSDFEKCLALYRYISDNYVYDTEEVLDRSEDGSGVACLKNKMGICADFSAWYAYLLLECGVDAVAVGNAGTEDSAGEHAWTLVNIDGENYHIDPTWSLKADPTVDTITLEYFMMTDDNRTADGYPPELSTIYLIPYDRIQDCREYDFTCDDTRYRLPEYSRGDHFDPDKNVLYYYNYAISDDLLEFHYEE